MDLRWEPPKFDPVRRFFNKWEMYRLLQNRTLRHCLLPVTVLYTADELEDMGRRFPVLYVKPVHAWGGRMIGRIERKDGRWLWILQGAPPERAFSSLRDLHGLLATYYPPGTAIIQEAAPVVTLDGRPFDVRVHLTRQVNASWTVFGVVARVAGAGSLVSNVAVSRGCTVPVPRLLHQLRLNSRRSGLVLRRVRNAGMEICGALDAHHRFEEVGIDLGLAHDDRLWLFEVNTDDLFGRPSRALHGALPTAHPDR